MNKMSPSDNHKLCNNSTSIIQSIPVEILTMIFFSAGPPSARDPYVYFKLSWVCRQWRSILLENPNFWTILRFQAQSCRSNPSLIREIIDRSKSHQLDIFTCPNDLSAHPDVCLAPFIAATDPLRSLIISTPRFECPEFNFSQLQNLILDDALKSYGKYNGALYFLLSKCCPRFFQFSSTLSARPLLYKPIISHIEWFKFNCASTIPRGMDVVRNFHNVLSQMPNLRILNIIMAPPETFYQYWHAAPAPTAMIPITTLPNLRMLSLDLWRDGFHRIHAPVLEYIGLSHFSNKVTPGWDLLDSFDLSMAKSFCVKLYDSESRWKCTGHQYVANFPIACIAMGDSDDNCQVFKNFHERVSSSVAKSVDSQLVLPPKHSFHIELYKLRDLETLSNHFKRATNLVELTLNYQSSKTDRESNAVVSEVLGTCDTVIHLNVLHCRRFSLFCDILTRRRNVPRLERLIYHSSYNPVNGTAFVSRRLKTMQNSRVEFDCEPLKVLELRNFVVLSPREVEEIEELGIQLIQVS